MYANLPCHTCNVDDVVVSIRNMRQQEDSGYLCGDYLRLHQQHIREAMRDSPVTVDADCRFKMSEWCYQVVDFCKFNRETVAIAMSYLDRYLMTDAGAQVLCNRKLFQLAAMTCLYTAIKIHEPEAMEPKIVAGLSRGRYTEEQVCEMELSILTNIQWRMNPPTALSFFQHFLSLIPTSVMDEKERIQVSDMARLQIELAVSEYSLVETPASTVAFAAISNALPLECLAELAKIAQINECFGCFIRVQAKLHHVMKGSRSNGSKGGLAPKFSTVVSDKEDEVGLKRRISGYDSPRGVASPTYQVWHYRYSGKN